MIHMRGVFVACAFAVLVIGCSTKSFKVEARNDTQGPVTLWLTKDGPPAEEMWRSPEELTAGTGANESKYDFAVVEPGQTGYTDSVSGHFPNGAHALLRIYGGAVDYMTIARAAGTARERRADYVLKPGTNKVVVRETLGRLVIERE